MMVIFNFLLLLCVVLLLVDRGECFLSPSSLQRTNNARSLQPTSTSTTTTTITDVAQRQSATRLSLAFVALNDIPSAYTSALAHYQLPTESATTAFLAGVGDIVAQTLPQEKQQGRLRWNNSNSNSIDWSRYQTFILKGSVSGILWSKWYAFCDPFSLNIAQTISSTFADGHVSNLVMDVSNLQLFTCILLEQFIWCPILYSLWDIPFPMVMRGDDIDTIPDKVQSTIGSLLWENAKVWTFANLFIYNIPLQWRVVIVSLTDVVWQSILSSSIATSETPVELPSEPQPLYEHDEQQPRSEKAV